MAELRALAAAGAATAAEREEVAWIAARELARDRKTLASFGRFTRAGYAVREAAAVLATTLRKHLFRSEGIAAELVDTILDRAAELRCELEGPRPSAVERLLADRVLVTWLDAQAAAADRDFNDRPGADLRYLRYLDGRLDRATRRHLAAVKALAAVRRLDLSGVVVRVDARSLRLGAAPPPALETASPPVAPREPADDLTAGESGVGVFDGD